MTRLRHWFIHPPSEQHDIIDHLLPSYLRPRLPLSFASINKPLNMASSTKYQPAPQRDSLDEPSYSQQPPSYQAAGPSVAEGGYGSAGRSEDDNIPDDFKVSLKM